LSKSLAKELGSRGVRVNVVEPGFVDTEMTRGIPQAKRDAILSSTALRRFGSPKEIAKLCAFLYSEESTFITGQVIRACGGLEI
jgi:3-oxoacyl-[acyl-carrier protein] reductase